MVCTSAYGVGINLNKVVLTIHVSAFYGFTDFRQESGRAGRRGEKVRSVCFVSPREKSSLSVAKNYDGHNEPNFDKGWRHLDKSSDGQVSPRRGMSPGCSQLLARRQP
jgi:superfamily II DNA helicase RecQ